MIEILKKLVKNTLLVKIELLRKKQVLETPRLLNCLFVSMPCLSWLLYCAYVFCEQLCEFSLTSKTQFFPGDFCDAKLVEKFWFERDIITFYVMQYCNDLWSGVHKYVVSHLACICVEAWHVEIQISCICKWGYKFLQRSPNVFHPHTINYLILPRFVFFN